MYQIDTDLPVPAQSTGRPRTFKYPWPSMVPGESVLITGVGKQAVMSSCSRYGKATGKRFTSRKTTDGYRVWRVA